MFNTNFNFKDMISSLKKKEELIEKTKFKYMGKANDNMADFLGEIENQISKGSKEAKIMEQIDNDWDTLWDKIIKLVKSL